MALGAAIVFGGTLTTSAGVRAANPFLTALPGTVTIPSGQQTTTTRPVTLTWDTGGPTTFALIEVQHNNDPTQILASCKSPSPTGTGTCKVDVGLGDNTFSLHDSNGKLLAPSVDVKGVAPGPPNGGIVKTTCLTDPKCAGALLTPPGPTPPPLVLDATWLGSTQNLDQANCGGWPVDLGWKVPNGIPGAIATGYLDYFDGSCMTATSYRGGVGFDWGQVFTYVKAHGFKTAYLRYISFLGDGAQCLRHIEENYDDVNSYSPWPSQLPDGPVFPGPVVADGGFGYKVDLGGSLIKTDRNGWVDPNFHFVFRGDEGLMPDNAHCWALFANFYLTITPDH